ncbi:16763_t:CDS:2 [Funneliformis mosseae]|uniref:16763_t:CDS:1 n=1 Tax=Funneliformis mosseae TaxID=27381 RepID=A0A9N8V510_FUNMO|nr:16763_t:CDS:2 [Funneliformis mosseae]
MIRKIRTDKKDTICKRGNVAFTKVPIIIPIQEFMQHPIREPIQTLKLEMTA